MMFRPLRFVRYVHRVHRTKLLPSAPTATVGGPRLKLNMPTRHRHEPEPLLPAHGGYRNLKSFVVAQLVYDLTVRFCDRYISLRSRTHDQMVQAARSGVQNIAEGSVASGTSKKMELKLTNVARASLEELRLDYEDFLRQRRLHLWPNNDPRRYDLVERRFTMADQVVAWIRDVGVNEPVGGAVSYGPKGPHGHPASHEGASGGSVSSVESIERPPTSSPKHGRTSKTPALDHYAAPAANAVLVLTGVAISLLKRQINAQARSFEEEGGFTERLYRVRRNRRRP